MIEANAEVSEDLCSNTPLEHVGADFISYGWQDRIGLFKRGTQLAPVVRLIGFVQPRIEFRSQPVFNFRRPAPSYDDLRFHNPVPPHAARS